MRSTRPKLVFPMHYRTPKVNLDILPVEAFLDLVSDLEIIRPGTSVYDVTPASLPEETTVVVLDHAR